MRTSAGSAGLPLASMRFAVRTRPSSVAVIIRSKESPNGSSGSVIHRPVRGIEHPVGAAGLLVAPG